MAWSISAVFLIWVFSIHLLSQAFGIPNDTATFETVVPDFYKQGKTSEIITPNRRDLLSIDTIQSSLYLSALTFKPNYELMLGSFKIYIYPRKQQFFGSPEWCGNQRLRDLDAPGALFYENLLTTDFITDDPEKAQLFFLPFSIDVLGIRSSPTSISRFLRRYIDDLRAEYPYWNRTLGADHFYFSCEGIDIDSTRNVVELKKNAIQISCYPLNLDGGNARFYPHKDISIPPIVSVMGVYQTQKFETLNFRHNDRESRTVLVYHVGSLELIPGLDSVFKVWKSDSDFVLDQLLPEPDFYGLRLSSSRFCLHFFGNGGNSAALVDALTFGCIPVIISQGPLLDLPLQDILNWQEFVVITNMRHVSKLKQTLQKIPEPQIQKMQSLSIEASKHLRWHSTPQSYDAFYSLMYQLWLRRHTIRYAQRHVSS